MVFQWIVKNFCFDYIKNLLCRRWANHGCIDSFINTDRSQLFVEIIYKEKDICKKKYFYEKQGWRYMCNVKVKK